MLYDRIVNEGTLADPGGVPNPTYALPSTLNWMRALAHLVDHHGLTYAAAGRSYGGLRRNASLSRQAENTVFEQLFLALHQLSALDYLSAAPIRADVARLGVVAWYYGVYYASRAMLVAQTGDAPDNHAGVATAWDRQLAATGRVLSPFELRVTTLVERDTKAELTAITRGVRRDLQRTPGSADEAHGACCSYLSGSADWYREGFCEALKEEREFRDLGVADFRTKAAKALRDRRLAGRSVGFLHQATRYRGKANYREALFLAYGAGTEAALATYLHDLQTVLRGFLAMAGAHVERRLGGSVWTEFVDDVETNRAFSLGPRAVWA